MVPLTITSVATGQQQRPFKALQVTLLPRWEKILCRGKGFRVEFAVTVAIMAPQNRPQEDFDVSLEFAQVAPAGAGMI
jgi:hypothetical protein